MRIVHFSDWHGNYRDLPPADLYVCTGDMLTNFPLPPGSTAPQLRKNGTVRYWTIDKANEADQQAKWVHAFVLDGGFRRFLGSPDAPLVCVRGNHDFTDLAPLFQGCNLVHEFTDNEVADVAGLRITGHRGIPWIFGNWNDETPRSDLKDRFRKMPHADLYLTHYPCNGILDSEIPPDSSAFGGWNESYGLEGMADWLLYRADRALHLFGHIHECGGRTKKLGDVTFSNAATGINVLDW